MKSYGQGQAGGILLPNLRKALNVGSNSARLAFKAVDIDMARDYKNSNRFSLVNEILADWNPLGVPDTVADSEYSSYVPEILKYYNDH